MVLKIWLALLALLLVLARPGHAEGSLAARSGVRQPLAESAPSPCEANCKVRIHACHVAAPARCFTEDVHPDRAGLCAYMLMGVTTEWRLSHSGETFKGAECVAPDDSEL